MGGSERPCFAACLPNTAAAAVQPRTRNLQAEALGCGVSVTAMLAAQRLVQSRLCVGAHSNMHVKYNG